MESSAYLTRHYNQCDICCICLVKCWCIGNVDATVWTPVADFFHAFPLQFQQINLKITTFAFVEFNAPSKTLYASLFVVLLLKSQWFSQIGPEMLPTMHECQRRKNDTTKFYKICIMDRWMGKSRRFWIFRKYFGSYSDCLLFGICKQISHFTFSSCAYIQQFSIFEL